ncbi:MAG: hypothetical protein N3B13_02770, partial [Deltaproteobacteria bacterium]|nr:hypothetical protein [Deltaproteobacteria bacterium]
MKNLCLFLSIVLLVAGCYFETNSDTVDSGIKELSFSDTEITDNSDIRDYVSDNEVESDYFLFADSEIISNDTLSDEVTNDAIGTEIMSDTLLSDTCIRYCNGRECGSDNCGGECGICGSDEFCNSEYRCEKNCRNECEREGTIVCTQDGRYRGCIRDDKGCLYLGETKSCPDSNLCSQNQCAEISFLIPADNSLVKNPVEFKVIATKNIKKVVYDADGYVFGSSEDAESGFSYTYSFTKFGERIITVKGYDGIEGNSKIVA